jgi:replication factor A2
LTGKNVSGKVVYTASRIDQVKEWNDVLFHFAYCMHIHAAGERESTDEPASKMTHLESSNLAKTTESTSAFAAIAGSLNPIQAAVLKVYTESRTPEGVHIIAVVRRLSEKYAEQAIRQTVQWLLDEGYLYVTIDNDHAKSVME